jgi:type IV fimbrial biogenesis protein FimT
MLPRTRSASAGFTLVELIITLTMAAILIGIALPAFNDLLRQRSMTARINDLVVALTYARSEAVRQGQRVSVVAAAADDRNGNEWGGGYCVVVGNPPPADCAGAVSGTVLRGFEGFADATLSSPGVTVLSFNARGLLVGGQPVGGQQREALEISLCSRDRNVDPGRVLTVYPTGRAEVAERTCHPS